MKTNSEIGMLAGITTGSRRSSFGAGQASEHPARFGGVLPRYACGWELEKSERLRFFKNDLLDIDDLQTIGNLLGDTLNVLAVRIWE